MDPTFETEPKVSSDCRTSSSWALNGWRMTPWRWSLNWKSVPTTGILAGFFNVSPGIMDLGRLFHQNQHVGLGEKNMSCWLQWLLNLDHSRHFVDELLVHFVLVVWCCSIIYCNLSKVWPCSLEAACGCSTTNYQRWYAGVARCSDLSSNHLQCIPFIHHARHVVFMRKANAVRAPVGTW